MMMRIIAARVKAVRVSIILRGMPVMLWVYRNFSGTVRDELVNSYLVGGCVGIRKGNIDGKLIERPV